MWVVAAAADDNTGEGDVYGTGHAVEVGVVEREEEEHWWQRQRRRIWDS